MKRDKIIPILAKAIYHLGGSNDSVHEKLHIQGTKAIDRLRGILSEVPNDKEWKQYQKIADKAHRKYGNNTDIELRVTHTGIGTVFCVWVKEEDKITNITDFDSW